MVKKIRINENKDSHIYFVKVCWDDAYAEHIFNVEAKNIDEAITRAYEKATDSLYVSETNYNEHSGFYEVTVKWLGGDYEYIYEESADDEEEAEYNAMWEAENALSIEEDDMGTY